MLIGLHHPDISAVDQSLALGIHKSVRLVRTLLDRNFLHHHDRHRHVSANFVIAHMNLESQHAQLHHIAANSAAPSDISKAVRCVHKLDLAQYHMLKMIQAIQKISYL